MGKPGFSDEFKRDAVARITRRAILKSHRAFRSRCKARYAFDAEYRLELQGLLNRSVVARLAEGRADGATHPAFPQEPARQRVDPNVNFNINY
jgi:hypothetical protein